MKQIKFDIKGCVKSKEMPLEMIDYDSYNGGNRKISN